MNDRCGQTWQVWWDQANPTTVLFLRSFAEGELTVHETLILETGVVTELVDDELESIPRARRIA